MTSISQENGKCVKEKEVTISKKGKPNDKANKDGKRSFKNKKGSKNLKEYWVNFFANLIIALFAVFTQTLHIYASNM